MSWLDRLQPASFRGVNFHVEDTSGSGGRRIVKHNYPYSSKHFIEDLGIEAKQFNIEVYIINDDYDHQRDVLLKALDKGGAGDFIHPTIGRKSVFVGQYSYRESRKDGNYCTFSISLTEAGKDQSWGVTSDTSGAAKDAASNLNDVTKQSFKNNYNPVSADWTQEESGMIISEIASNEIVLTDSFDAYDESDASIIDSLTDAAKNGANYLKENGIDGIVDVYDAAATRNPSAAISSANNLLNSSSQAALKQTTATQKIRSQNIEVTNLAIKTAALSGKGAALASSDFDNQDAAKMESKIFVSQASSLSRQISRSKYSGTMRQDVVPAIGALSNAVSNDIKTRGEKAKKLSDYERQSSAPSVVAAYDLYEDPKRGNEIASRLNHRGSYMLPNKGKVLSA